MPPKKKDSKMTSPELRKLIRAHNKLSNIKIPKGSTRDEIIIIIEKNGYTVDHVNKELKPKVKRGKIISVKQADKMFPKKTEAQKKEAKDKKEAKKKEAEKERKEREGKLIEAGATMQKALAKKKEAEKKKKEAPKKKGKEIGTQTEDPKKEDENKGTKIVFEYRDYKGYKHNKSKKVGKSYIKTYEELIKKMEEFMNSKKKINPLSKLHRDRVKKWFNGLTRSGTVDFSDSNKDWLLDLRMTKVPLSTEEAPRTALKIRQFKENKK